MFSYCLKCRENTESKYLKVVKTKNGSIMLLSKYSVCKSKKPKFPIEQDVRGLLNNFLGVKAPILSDIAVVNTLLYKYKMNSIVNKLLLAGDKFMPEMHLKQSGFTYSA